MKSNAFIWAAIGLTVFSSCQRSSGPRQTEPKEYQTIVVTLQDTHLDKAYPATVKGQEDIEIRPRIDGFIEEIYIDEGSVVGKGQPLFKIDSPESEKEYLSARAQVESSRASVNTARLDVERVEPLAKKGILSDVRLKNARNAYESAQAGLVQAEAALRNATATRSWTIITSPVDGMVGTIPYRRGSLVNSQNVLTTVANTGNVYAYFSINEKDYMEICGKIPGATPSDIVRSLPEATLLLPNGERYSEKGTIETVAGIVNTSTGTVNLRACFPNRDNLLRSGISGKVILPFEIKNVHVIPQEATFALQDRTMVYTVQEDNSVKAEAVSVIALSDGKHYAVTDGLAEGQTIIAGGVATLSEGTVIKTTSKTSYNAQ